MLPVFKVAGAWEFLRSISTLFVYIFFLSTVSSFRKKLNCFENKKKCYASYRYAFCKKREFGFSFTSRFGCAGARRTIGTPWCNSKIVALEPSTASS